jgi:hypothetical protein
MAIFDLLDEEEYKYMNLLIHLYLIYARIESSSQTVGPVHIRVNVNSLVKFKHIYLLSVQD